MFEHHVLVLHESKEHGFFNNVPFFKPLKYAQSVKKSISLQPLSDAKFIPM